MLLQLEFQNCVNGIVVGCYTGTLAHSGDITITTTSTGALLKPYSFSGISIKLQVSCNWICLLDHSMYFDTIILKFDPFIS